MSSCTLDFIIHTSCKVHHVLALAEPDEFRRIFHGWLNMRAESDAWTTHERRRDKHCRRVGLAGRVLRDRAWPGSSADGAHGEAEEEITSGGVVLFSTSCCIVRETRAACARSPWEPKSRPSARSLTAA